MNLGEKLFEFHRHLSYNGDALPEGVSVMNPFTNGSIALDVAKKFFQKYFNDHHKRHLILGINPGRFGAGVTGVPFTDPKRLVSECNIAWPGKISHEPSSVFVYEMINAYGGVKSFYQDFYINSPSPLGYLSVNAKGKEVNHNYYDSAKLLKATTPFIHQSLGELTGLGFYDDSCICLGTGKNYRLLERFNDDKRYFKKIIPLEHPRYIMQYKSADKNIYIDKYVNALRSIAH
jgi:uracil DNA glycosylase superfamily protein